MRKSAFAAFTLFALWCSPTFAETVSRSADFDRWMYPFNASPGFRGNAPIFGAVGEGDSFDDFDGQFLVGFNTSAAGVPTSVPEGFKLLIHSVRVTATHSSGAFIYDPTFDPYQSHLDPSDPDYVADSDGGRPIEIWGAGLRGGFTSFGFGATVPGGATFEEGDIFAFGDPTAARVRNAYAYDPNFGDVSNVVTDRLFTATPWAIGANDALTPGSLVPQGVPGVSVGATFTFDIDLSRPEVLAYVMEGISDGGLFFTITSLASTTQGGTSNPNFYTRETFDPAALGAAPAIFIDYAIVPVPEPGTLALAASGFGLMGLLALRRKGIRRAA